MSDTLPTATRVADPGIRALYRLENRWQAWLDVETALARAQAERGIIPQPAAEAIAQAARLDKLDRARIDEGFARTGHTIVPLVWELSRIVGEPHGGWVHWGATTQNITQTGDLLVLRQAHTIFLRQIGDILTAMATLAEKSAEMPIAGRTHGQHAVPATFGYKVAVWIDELIRHTDRFRQAAPRLFVAMLGGGAGTYASLGQNGPPIQQAIGRLIGFGSMTVPSRAIGDHLAENILLLGLLAATCGKIGREIYTLMKTEFGEVEEPVPPGTVGSSTMPQKRNPKLCQDVIAAAAEIRAMVPLALEAMTTEHEADRTTSLMMDTAESRACIATGDMLARLHEIMAGLRLDPARMRSNLDLGGGLIMAEAVMLDLGAAIGRQHAHDAVYDAAQDAFTQNKSFGDLLAADPRVTAHMAPQQIKNLLDPTAYTGLCADMAREGASRARAAAKGLVEMTELNVDHLRTWIGRQETLHDQVTRFPIAALSATLDRDDPTPAAGDPLPPLWHWLYFLPTARQSILGPDGHPARGGFLPPVPLPRRMWAGGRFTFHQPLRVDEAITRVSTVQDVTIKQGRNGALCFVLVKHQVSGENGPALDEEHDIVYRDAPAPDEPAPTPPTASAESAWHRDIHPTDPLLFRYSALTFNSHRIHYDRRYVTETEGYPGLIVHGPLIATLLIDLLRRNTDQPVKSFRFRAISPLFDIAPFSVHGTPDGKLWARNPTGHLAMEAEATF